MTSVRGKTVGLLERVGFVLGAAGGAGLGALSMHRRKDDCGGSGCFGPSSNDVNAFAGGLIGAFVGLGIGVASSKSEKWIVVH